MAEIAMASRMLGKASITSMSPISTVSRVLPQKPATTPMTVPMNRPIPTETNPIKTDSCAPNSSRVKMSRPSLSVPARCAKDGASVVTTKFCARGSRCPERSGAPIAQIADGLLRKRRQVSAKTVVCGASSKAASCLRACSANLDFHDDGHDHRPALGALVDELGEAFVDVLADGGPLGQTLGCVALHDGACMTSELVHKAVALARASEREAARGHIGTGEHLAVEAVHRDGHDDHAVGR